MRSKLTALAVAAVLFAASVPLAEARGHEASSPSAGFAHHAGWLGALGLVGLLARRKPRSIRRAV
jgi:MYXO-CTERM domain-containing protein